MAEDEVRPKIGRIRDASRTAQPRLRRQVFQQAGKAGLRARWSKGHVKPGALTRGMGTGVRAAAGLIAPGSRRVVVKARYTRIISGDLGAARAHLKYIQRDGVTREGSRGSAYDANRDDVDQGAFLQRSKGDPHQFRIILSPEDGDRLHDLKPLVRDLLGQMERDLGTRLDWVAVDHFNTGHPHSHIVIRGKDDQGRDLVMARDYIGHGIRARAQGLITLELGPETTLERLRKQQNEIALERLTSLDRSILARARDSIIVANLRRRELLAELRAEFVPRATGESVHSIYVRAVNTATGNQAVLRSQDTFTLAPWKPALEPLRGLAVTGTIGRGRVTWTLERTRPLPSRT